MAFYTLYIILYITFIDIQIDEAKIAWKKKKQ